MNIETPNRVKLDDCLRLVHRFPWLPAGIFAGTEMMPNMKQRIFNPGPNDPVVSTDAYQLPPLAGRGAELPVEVGPITGETDITESLAPINGQNAVFAETYGGQ